MTTELINTMKEKGYVVFEGDYDLNIIGIRSKTSKSDSFDDEIHVLYKLRDSWQHESFAATTDPGKHWLLNPMNVKGTIIMVPGQYRSVYQLGIHGINGSDPHEALRQIGKIAYVRDNNRDNKLDFDLYKDSKNIFWDIAYTNIHRASRLKTVLGVGMYSAGCQVIQKPSDFDRFMYLCKQQKRYGHGDKFTYTLLDEQF